MRVQIPTSSALLLTVAVLLTEASSHGHIDTHLAKRHHQLGKRQPQPVPPVPPAFMKNRQSCKRGESESCALSSMISVALSARSIKATSSSESSPASGKHSTTSSSSGDTGSEAAGGFKPVKPKHWPTATQSGPKPTSTRTSDADKYLGELSKAIDNSGNPLFTESHTGDMTYYTTGVVACGDVYDENSFTAAVYQDMYNNWPGANGQDNQNPICGPYVPGRKILNSQGTFDTVKLNKTSVVAGFAAIGGDGVLACPQSIGVAGQCHIPLTATVTLGGKSVQVQIVDRCPECKEGDIDMTKTAFSALADWHEGRVTVTWKFDNW
ncbi:hypothetical protein C8R46DRAFT_1235207 [Mycena filopes]|nr:hypothetical protein C8R46DRAFT_1235207 [Mycena filopes]